MGIAQGPFERVIQDDVTSLMVAVYYGFSEVVDILLRAKADVNITSKVRSEFSIAIIIFTECVQVFTIN